MLSAGTRLACVSGRKAETMREGWNMIRQHLRQWHEKVILATTLATMLATLAHAQLPNTQPLTSQDDLAMKMVAGTTRPQEELRPICGDRGVAS